MKKIVSIALALALALTGVFLSACGGAPPPLNDGPAASGSPQAAAAGDNTMRTYLKEEPKSLDPSLASDESAGYVFFDTTDSLTRLVGNENGEYVFEPAGAKSWDTSEDGTVWTFHLNDNVWSDGVPVTAQDYLFAIQRTANPATGAPLVDMLFPLLNFDAVVAGDMPVEELGVKALDDKTLEFTLSEPTPFFLSLTYDRVFAPQRADLLEKYGDTFGSEAESCISNGPFKVESWVHNSAITLVKNEHYWDADSVKLDKVIYNIMTDNSTRLNAFESNELDYIIVTDTEWRDRFQAKEGTQYHQVETNVLTYSFFNNSDPIFQNANIRKAFMLGLDREELNTMALGGLRVPTYGWVIPSISVDDVNYREATGDTIKEIAAASESPKDLLIKGMEELGLGNDPSTLEVTFSLAGTDDWFQTLGAYLQQAYKTTLGVNLEISFNEWGVFYDSVQNGSYQIGFMNWGAFYNDPYDVLSLFTSGSNAIMTNWSNSEYDELLLQARKEMDPDKRIALYQQAESIMLNDAAACPLTCSTNNVFYSSRVQGARPTTFGTEGYKYVSIA